jgi:hypothetical protein
VVDGDGGKGKGERGAEVRNFTQSHRGTEFHRGEREWRQKVERIETGGGKERKAKRLRKITVLNTANRLSV